MVITRRQSHLSYDPEKAKELLKEAGFEDGFKTTIWTNDNQQRMDIAVILQEELKQVNIDVEIQVLEWGAYLDNTAKGEHDMFILGLIQPSWRCRLLPNSIVPFR